MKQLAQFNNFHLFITIAPLECEINSVTNCNNDPNSPVFQQLMMNVAKQNAQFLSMVEPATHGSMATGSGSVLGVSYPEATDSAKTDLSRLFSTTQDKNPPGIRHLSPAGNEVFGKILFNNFATLTE